MAADNFRKAAIGLLCLHKVISKGYPKCHVRQSNGQRQAVTITAALNFLPCIGVSTWPKKGNRISSTSVL